MMDKFIWPKIKIKNIRALIKRGIDKINKFIEKNSPPGMDMRQDKFLFVFGMFCAVCYSLSFLLKYWDELSKLYYWKESDNSILLNAEKVLREGAVMPDFVDIVGGSMVIFVMLGFLMIGLIVFRIVYFWQGSKSIYLMRRLPKKRELYKRILLIPILAACLCALAAILMIMIYFAVYMLSTPKQCIAPGQWEILWRWIL